MSYTINLTNGTVFAVVADGTINNTSSVTLVGKNYAGYGEFLDENFIQMLENFSNSTPPTTPLTGQLWYDSAGALLKIYNGSIWKTVSAATASNSTPTNSVTGDLWFDTLNQQLKVYNGSAFIVVGPAYSSAQGVSGAVPLSINDIAGTPHLVTGIYSNNSLVSIVNPGADFLPAAPYNADFPKIYKGSTVWAAGVQSGNISNPGNVVVNSGGYNTLTISTSGIVVSGTVSATGNIGGNYYTGNGRFLSGIEVSGTNQINTTGNIFGGNLLTSGMVSAAGSIRTAGYVSATGNITGNYFFGNAAFLTGLPAIYGNAEVSVYLASGSDTNNIVTTATVRGATVSATGAVTSPSIVGGVITGSSVSVTGSITGATASIGGTVSVTGGTVSAAGSITASGGFSGPSVSGGVMTGTSASVTGSVAGGVINSSGNIYAGQYLFGNAAYLVGLPASYTDANVAAFLASGSDAYNIVTTATVKGATVSATGSVTSPAITGGTITGSSLSVSGGVSGAGVTMPSGAYITTGSATNTGTITGNWSLSAGSKLSATYADLAERFEADEYMPAGTVVELGGEKEITRARKELTDEVFGVISTNAAYLMNGAAGTDLTHPPIAMTGRVPVLVVGKVRKGQRLVTAGNGVARAAKPGEATPFNVIGRALVHKTTDEQGTVEAIVTIK